MSKRADDDWPTPQGCISECCTASVLSALPLTLLALWRHRSELAALWRETGGTR